jgi:hypothetical protein
LAPGPWQASQHFYSQAFSCASFDCEMRSFL